MIDKETLTKLGAIVKEITVSYSRKISDGDYGSVGGDFFVTIDVRADADPEAAGNAAFEWLKQFATENLRPSFEAVRKPRDVTQPPEPEGLPLPPAQPSAPLPEGEQTLKIVEFEMSLRTDGKYQLALYGEGHEHPDIKYVADRDAMWNMLMPISAGLDFRSLPLKLAVSWLATWKQGRATGKFRKDGSPGYYKDLVSLKKT